MQCRDAFPQQNQWRSVQIDHLRESALLDDITGVGPETSTPTSPGKWGLSRNEYNDEEPVTPEGQVLRGHFVPENHLRRRARAI